MRLAPLNRQKIVDITKMDINRLNGTTFSEHSFKL
jgi:hypothetical protein